jgi:hypothetical protein
MFRELYLKHMLRFVLNRKIEHRGAPARSYHTRGDLLLPLPPPPSWLWSPLSLSKPVGDREEERGGKRRKKNRGFKHSTEVYHF